MTLTPAQIAIQEAVREFAREEIRPTATTADREATFPEALWDGLADLDLTGLTVPAAYGGFDADSLTSALVNEELAYGMLAVATALSVHNLATTCIAEFGDSEQRERWLPAMVEGRPVGAFALSEPHAGSNPKAMTTVARRVGDEYVIDGEKQWITNGQRAGVIVLFAKTDPADDDSITQFVVPADTAGLTVGEPEDKLGLRASDTTSLTFEDVRIPASNRLTEEGAGLSAALHVLTDGRIAIAAQAVGLARHALEEAIQYSQQRRQFDAPLATIQTIRHKLAEMATRTKTARLITHDAASRRDAGEGRLEASMAKYVASETAMFVTNECVQIHGGYGYVTDGEVERLYRDAKVTEIYEGTSEIQRSLIARHLLE